MSNTAAVNVKSCWVTFSLCTESFLININWEERYWTEQELKRLDIPTGWSLSGPESCRLTFMFFFRNCIESFTPLLLLRSTTPCNPTRLMQQTHGRKSQSEEMCNKLSGWAVSKGRKTNKSGYKLLVHDIKRRQICMGDQLNISSGGQLIPPI